MKFFYSVQSSSWITTVVTPMDSHISGKGVFVLVTHVITNTFNCGPSRFLYHEAVSVPVTDKKFILIKLPKKKKSKHNFTENPNVTVSRIITQRLAISSIKGLYNAFSLFYFKFSTSCTKILIVAQLLLNLLSEVSLARTDKSEKKIYQNHFDQFGGILQTQI